MADTAINSEPKDCCNDRLGWSIVAIAFLVDGEKSRLILSSNFVFVRLSPAQRHDSRHTKTKLLSNHKREDTKLEVFAVRAESADFGIPNIRGVVLQYRQDPILDSSRG